MNKCVVLILFALIHFLADSQIYKQSQLDKLKKEIKYKKGDDKIESLLTLSEAHLYFQLDSAKKYANDAQKLALDGKNQWAQYKSAYLMAKVNTYQKGDPKDQLTLERCAVWFNKHGYSVDYVKCHITLITISLLSNGVGENIAEVERILGKAKETKNDRLIGEVFLLKQSALAMELTGKFYYNELDSAYLYFARAGDSTGIILTKIQCYSYEMHDPTGVLDVMKDFEKTKVWGNRFLEIRINAYLAIHNYVTGKIDLALVYLKEALKFSKKLGNKSFEERVQTTIGESYASNGEYEKSIQALSKALKLSKTLKNKRSEVTLYDRIGSKYKVLGNNIEAINYFIIALEKSKKLNWPYYFQICSRHLAECYLLTKEYDKAEKILLETYNWADKNAFGRIKAQIQSSACKSLAGIYRDQRQYAKGHAIIQKTLNGLKKYSYNEVIDFRAVDMAMYLDERKMNKAESVWKKIVELNDSLKLDERSFSVLSNPFFKLQEGRLMLMSGHEKGAIEKLNEYIDNSPAKVSEDRKMAFKLLAQAYKSQGEFKKSLNAYENYNMLNDSLRQMNTVENLSLIQSKYELSLSEATIKEMAIQEDLRQEKQKNEIANDRRLMAGLGVGIVLIILTSLVFFRRLQLKKEQKEVQLTAEKLILEKENFESKSRIELMGLKNELLSNVSHEFRTPLTLIQVPLKNWMKRATKDEEAILQPVIKNTEHLIQMMEEMLELSRMDAGTMQLQKSPVVLSDFLNQIKYDFKPFFESKKIHFDFPSIQFDGIVIIDHHRLKMVVNNMLKNAAEHTPENGRVGVKVDYKDDDRTGLSVSITNTSDGIEKFDPKKVFERYYRGNPEKYNGSGIGLTLSKEIVEMHDGTIEACTQNDQEVTFCFFIPLEITEMEVKNEATDPSKESESPITNLAVDDQKKRTILIVEDNSEMRSLLALILEAEFNLLLVNDGKEVKQLLSDHLPDLILSDVMMPKMDGFELLAELKNTEEFSHIPVILLTARADRESKLTGLDEDADDYIAKPFDADELISRIKNILRRRNNLRSLFRKNPLLLVPSDAFSWRDTAFLEKARTIVQKNLDNGEFTVNQFCTELGLNRNSVHNKLIALTGESASTYIREIRLAIAVELLLTTNDTIEVIQMNTGFNSRQAFNKVFKSKFNMSPSEFRNHHQNN